GVADLGFHAPQVTAVLAKGATGYEFVGPIDTTLKAGAATVSAGLSLGSEAGIQLSETTLAALAGTAEIPLTTLTPDGSVIAPFALGGPANLAVGPGGMSLDDDGLSLQWDGAETIVAATGTLHALDHTFPLEAHLAEDGTYLFGGPLQAGTLQGLPATQIGAAISNDQGVTIGANVPVPEYVNTSVVGPWVGDDNFALVAEDSVAWNPDLDLATSLTLAPGGPSMAVEVNGEAVDPQLAGALEGPITHDEATGYDYHLNGPADLAPAGLELGTGGMAIDSELGFSASGTADIGLAETPVAANFEKGNPDYAFVGAFDAALSAGAVTTSGTLLASPAGGLLLSDVSVHGLGGTGTVAEYVLTADGTVVDPWELDAEADLMVGPSENHPLTGGALTLSFGGDNATIQAAASGAMEIAGQLGELLTTPIDPDGSYGFAGEGLLPLDQSALAAGLATISNIAPASFSGQLDLEGLLSGEFVAEVGTNGDITVTVDATLGPVDLELGGEVTYVGTAASQGIDGIMGFLFTSPEQPAEHLLDWTGDTFLAQNTGILHLPDDYRFTDAVFGLKGDQFCVVGKLFGATFDEICLDVPGDWSLETNPLPLELPEQPIAEVIFEAIWEAGVFKVQTQSITPAIVYENIPFPGDATVGVGPDGQPTILEYESSQPAPFSFTIPGFCAGFPIPCLPEEYCTFDGDAILTISNDVTEVKWCGTGSCYGNLGPDCGVFIDGFTLDVCELFGVTGLSAAECLQDATPTAP
ncbi:MAG: hypothetical protein ACI9WU_003366, partial [Myxococcota bacterium]